MNRSLDKRHWTTPIGHHDFTRVWAPRITVQASSVANVRSWASSKMMTLYLEKLCWWRIGSLFTIWRIWRLKCRPAGLPSMIIQLVIGLQGYQVCQVVASHHLFKASPPSYHTTTHRGRRQRKCWLLVWVWPPVSLVKSIGWCISESLHWLYNRFLHWLYSSESTLH